MVIFVVLVVSSKYLEYMTAFQNRGWFNIGDEPITVSERGANSLSSSQPFFVCTKANSPSFFLQNSLTFCRTQ